MRALIGHSDGAKQQKLIVAMEQARWLPNDLGSRYVFINQPAFMVYYHNNNREELSMRTVVGSKAHQTFFFEDEIQTVEFNPFWGVPQSIIINEMLPKLRADPGYLDRMGYEVAVNGQAVSSSSVNWYGSTNAISVRQPPSGDNALGERRRQADRGRKEQGGRRSTEDPGLCRLLHGMAEQERQGRILRRRLRPG